MVFIRSATVFSVAVALLCSVGVAAAADPDPTDPSNAPAVQSSDSVSSFPPCRLNDKFPPVSPRFGPISELLKDVDTSSPKAPYVGVWEASVKGEWARLVVLTQSGFGDSVHYAYESLDDGQQGFRPVTVSPEGMTWTSRSDTLTATRDVNDPSILLVTVQPNNEAPIVFKTCGV
jgi:hypothetical protein